MFMNKLQRIGGYLWAMPVTAMGVLLAIAAVLTGGTMRVRGGVIKCFGGCTRWLLRGSPIHRGGAALTLGHVILARDVDCLVHSRLHELHHVRQFEKWEPLLIPVFWAIALWLRCRGLDPYLDHPLEPPPR